MTQFAVCWYTLLLKYLYDGMWQVKDSLFPLGGWLCSLIYPNAFLALKYIVRERGQQEPGGHLLVQFFAFLTLRVPPLILAGSPIS